MTYLLEYKKESKDTPPFAPIEIWEGGILKETIIRWSWHSGDNNIFIEGWFPLKELNGNHPSFIERMKNIEKEQQKIRKLMTPTEESLRRRVTI